MKTLWTKNLLIGFLLITNSVTVASLFGVGPALATYLRGSPPPPAKVAHHAKPRVPAKKQASVSGADFTSSVGMQACYEHFLARDPKVDEGTLTVHWTVDTQGKVASIDMIKSELEDESFASCITDKLRAMNFSPAESDDGMLMAHRFNFRRRAPTSVNF